MRTGTAGVRLCVSAMLLGVCLLTAAPPDNRSRPRCARRAVILPWLLAPAALVAGYRVLTDRLAADSDEHVDRDPGTGILRGAESRELGPEQSPGAVLMVHGFIGTPRDFGDLPERLAARGWRVHAILLPGHGTSPRDLESERPETLRAAVRAAYDSLADRHERVVMIGHSMGATLCLLAAAERGPDALVIAAPYFSVKRKWYYGLAPETWTRMMRPAVRWVYKGDMFKQVNRPEAADEIISYRWVPLEGVRTLIALGERASQPETLGSVRCPVLMIGSEHDQAASPEAARTAFGLLGSERKRAVWVERSNHHVFWDYDRERVYDEIERFLGAPDGPAYE